jgi:hypothetical protein
MIKTIQNSLVVGQLLLLLGISALTGCGGGSGNIAGSSPFGEGGTSGTGVLAASVAKGTISGFGGLSTGGINYNIDAATISFNGQAGTEALLETGMVVNVNGEVNALSNTGTAENIIFVYKLAGVIDSINIATRTVIALEQKILFDEFTTFKNTFAGGLSVGDVILVSGFTDAEGKILATYIEEPMTIFPDSILEGVLTQIDANNKTFKIGGQLVNYSSAKLLNIQNDILLEGSLVRVTGAEAPIVQGALTTAIFATSVEGITGALTGNIDEDIRVEGLISQVSGSSSFRINGNIVTTNSTTQYTNGVVSDITVNARVFAIGTLDASGVISADSIRFILPADIAIEAKVDAIDITNNLITAVGRTVVIDTFTTLLDSSSANTQTFSLSNIAIDDRLKITGQDNGQVINAARIERVDTIVNNAQSIWIGLVEDSISSPQFSIAGLVIDTGSLQNLSGFSQGGITPISSSAFFASLQPGMIVQVVGEFLAGTLVPSHVEIVHCCNWEVYDSAGNFIGGGNDVAFTWDGSLNTDVFSNNVNATLFTNATIVGETSLSQDVRIFGPGNYIFDTGLDPSLTTDFGTTNLGGVPLSLVVGSGQVGAHGLFHFGMDGAPTVCGKLTCNIDVVFLWNVNAVYAGSTNNDSNLGAKGRIFNLSSVDGNGDGIPGIPAVDGPFVGFNTVYNLNLTSP